MGDEALLLTVVEAARRLSLGRTTVYAEIAAGRIDTVTVGRARRIPTAALEAYVARLSNKSHHDS